MAADYDTVGCDLSMTFYSAQIVLVEMYFAIFWVSVLLFYKTITIGTILICIVNVLIISDLWENVWEFSFSFFAETIIFTNILLVVEVIISLHHALVHLSWGNDDHEEM